MNTPFVPTHRFRLSVQEAKRVQASLFTPEPRTEPPCDHPIIETQRTLAGPDEEVCSVCLRVLSLCTAVTA